MRTDFSQFHARRAMAPRLAGALAFTFIASCSLPPPALAQGQNQAGEQQAAEEEAPDRPVTDKPVTVVDVAATPIEDLNLRKDEIPPLLLQAQADPYSTEGITRCSHYTAAISELDALLGPDFDVADPTQRKLTVGGVAKEVVGSFIPFRGVIREITGANKHQREFQDAVVAGVMRRSFLKGAGLKLGCQYPARPADLATRERIANELEQQRIAEENKKKDG